jgi:5-methylcytosine-specific restriction protein A
VVAPGTPQASARASRSRKTAWLRDELILALELYRRDGRNPAAAAVRDLSELLRLIPIEPELAQSASFRNPRAVALKVANFVAIDPGATTSGMSRGGRADQEVFAEFWADPARLTATAAAVRDAIVTIGPAGAVRAEAIDDYLAEAPEGRLLTRTHRVRERNSRLVSARKAKALQEQGHLQCAGCGFSFAAVYGARGVEFIECHHTLPLSSLRPNSKTRLEDLALVCSNCHRMIHRRAPWLTMDQLSSIITPIVPRLAPR